MIQKKDKIKRKVIDKEKRGVYTMFQSKKLTKTPIKGNDHEIDFYYLSTSSVVSL